MTVTDRWLQDLRHGVRRLRKQPGTTVAAALTLTLGIGANAAIFSVVRGVIVSPLPYPDADRLVYVQETKDGRRTRVSYENFRDWQRETESLSDMAVMFGNSVNLTGGDRPERLRGLFVTSSFFGVAGVSPVIGRALVEGEDVEGGPRVAVLSHAMWTNRYAADTSALGETIILNNVPHTIVGVMPKGYLEFWDSADVWVSLPTLAGWSFNRESRSVPAFARLADGVTLEGAQEELQRIHAGLAERYPDANTGWGVSVRSMLSVARAGNNLSMLTLVAAAGMVLLIACANVANLQLAQASARVREFGIRAALGGTRGRLASQLLVENVILGSLGGLGGIVAAHFGVRGLLALRPSLSLYEVGVSGGVLALSAVLAVGTGIIFGLAPAVRAANTDLSAATRSATRGGFASRAAGHYRNSLVVVQMALAVMLLTSAGLLIRTIGELSRVSVGFSPERLLTLEFRLPTNKYDTVEKRADFFDGILERAAAVPGVVAVASSSSLPFSYNGGSERAYLPGQPRTDDDAIVLQTNAVSPSFFETMQIPVIAGRGFERADRDGRPRVAIVSRDAAELLWDGDEPLGQIVYLGDSEEPITIVGVTRAVRVRLTGDPTPHIYLPYAQSPSILASLVVKTAGAPMDVAIEARQAIWDVDPDQPVWEIMPISDRIGRTVTSQRFLMTLLAIFSGIAIVLGGIGIYGVLGYSVNLRSKEIGVRVALGAASVQIRRMVLTQGLRLTAIGLVLGVTGALGLTRILRSTLFGVSPVDPITFVSAPILLALVAALACWIPARRATSVDPIRALQDG